MKIPTILGVLILIFGLMAGVFLINSKQIFKLGAEGETAPQNVRISNITDTSVTISWTTDIETTGYVKWGGSTNKLNKVSSEEDSDKNLIHSIDLDEISPDSDIFFVIGSSGKTYDNNGVVWQTKTNSNQTAMAKPITAAGTVLQSDAQTPANALVYLSINGILISNITSFEGSFVIPVSNYISSLPDTTLIEISAHAGPLGTSQAVIYPQGLKAVPTMVLGKTYDFRTASNQESGTLPESNVSVPETTEQTSRFEANKPEETPAPAIAVSLDSIDNDETITTTDPEFFGTGPAGIAIEIVVESELQTGTVTTNSDGTWNWSPPNNLEPGEHTVTLKWTDASGIIRSLQRNFVVSAAEGPAFVATTSGGLATPTAIPQVTATPQPVPETGDLTATLTLFIMGLGILLLSIFVWNKAYAEN